MSMSYLGDKHASLIWRPEETAPANKEAFTVQTLETWLWNFQKSASWLTHSFKCQMHSFSLSQPESEILTHTVSHLTFRRGASAVSFWFRSVTLMQLCEPLPRAWTWSFSVGPAEANHLRCFSTPLEQLRAGNHINSLTGSPFCVSLTQSVHYCGFDVLSEAALMSQYALHPWSISVNARFCEKRFG